MKDALGDRMKGYEATTRHLLPRRTYALLRVDGKAFHTYTRGLERPFDVGLMEDMNAVAVDLCKEISGSVLAFVQSDEISVLVQDFKRIGTQPWMGGVLAKWQSVGASIATAGLNHRRPDKRALFDARVFTLPDAVEVANYFVWRQKDAVRNSISMVAQANFSHRQLQGLSTSQMQELLWQEKGVNWNDLPAGWKRGRVVFKVQEEVEISYMDREEVTKTALRTFWRSEGAPLFSASPEGWLAAQIPYQAHLQEHSHS
jgi:tRNA(His) 5'-end guanylyltransferase